MITITRCQVTALPLTLRLPFRYGIATVTELIHVFVTVEGTHDGRPIAGVAAEHLSPKWFRKRADIPPAEDDAALLESIQTACADAEGRTAPTAFALWQQLYAAQPTAPDLPPLWTHFPVTLIERALIDALCRASATPFHTLLRTDGFGLELGALHPELAGTATTDWLPREPRASVLVRHTVGMADPLAGRERTDPLPRTLEDNIVTYGLRHFKLKLGGDPDHDAERVQAVLAICAAHAPADWAYTLDANESYSAFGPVRTFWEHLPAAAQSRCLFIEQPLHRDAALTDTAGDALAAWTDHPPILIDESDGALGDFPRALTLGYAGTSYKNCKGVFKGIGNTCLAAKRGAQLSGEDLTCVGPICLPQDLAAQAALGVVSIERNGHHYFAGLSMFPKPLQEATLAAHPDLYHRTAEGWPTLTITDGHLDLRSVNTAPFGTPVWPHT